MGNTWPTALTELAGEWGEPSVGEPIEYERLRVAYEHGSFEITLFNRGIMLIFCDDERIRRMHRAWFTMRWSGWRAAVPAEEGPAWMAPDTRVVNALVQLGQRDDAHGQAGGLQLLQPRRDGRNAVEVINDPVGVEEVARPHSRAGGRVVTRRSA